MDTRRISKTACVASQPRLGLIAVLVALLFAFFLLASNSALAGSLLQALTYTYTIETTSGSAVTMGDMADTVSFTVTNTGNDPNKPIDYVRLEFDASLYDVSNATAAPDGWSVDEIRNAGQGQAYVVFTANSTASALAPGEGLTFSVAVLGQGGAAFASAAADVSDELDQVVVEYSVFAPQRRDEETFTGNLASWPRRGLATDIIAVPPSVAVGDLVTVTMVIHNRSTALQQTITRTLFYTPSGLVALTDGPIPVTLTLASGDSDVITHTYQAIADGIVTFRGSAANASVTSDEVRSNEVVIGDFTALIEVDPTTIIAGQDVTVRMRVYNNTAGNLGNVRPSALGLEGDATAVSSSGPSPPVVPSLPAGSTTTFEWTYTLTGTIGSTYAFTGTAQARGSLETNVARSNDGVIAQYTAYVTPRRVGAGTATPLPLAFTVANNGATTLEMFRFALPPAFTDSGGVGETIGSVGTPCTWTYSGGDFTADGGCSGLPPGGTAVLTVTFSAIPTPVVDTNYSFHIDFCSGTNQCTTGSGVGSNWEGAVDAPFTITRYRIEMTADPTSLPADGFSTSVITATVYEGGAPIPGANVVFATTGTQGTLSAYDGTTNASGVITVTFTAPVDFVDSQAMVIATYLTAEGQTTLDLQGISGPNPLYVGGTLDPLVVQPGDSVAFSLDVLNAGSQPITLTTSSVFTFTDGAYPFSANLAVETTIPTDTVRTLTFNATMVDSNFAPGAYFPSLQLVDTDSQTYDRPVSDRVSVGVAALVSSLGAAPSVVNVGQQITVTMLVTNVGYVTATNVAPSALVVNPPGSASQLSGPDPVSVATLTPGAVQTFTWTYSATGASLVDWTGNAAGTDVTTGQPVESSLTTSNDVTVMQPAQLAALLSGAPATVSVGQTITVTMQADNTGDAAASDVAPEPLTMGGTGGASSLSGPTPPLVLMLGGGSSTSFEWTYRADAAGTVSWTGMVTGTDINDSRTVTDTATSNNVTIQTPAALSCGMDAAPSSVGTGALIYVTMTVTNTGQANAQNVNPSALTMSGTAAFVSGPGGAPAVIPGGTSAQFTWTYQATAVGAVNWTGNASGADANSGAPVSSANCSSNDVDVYGAAFLVSSIIAAPDAVGQNETVTVTMTVTNVGTNDASTVAPSALTLFDPLLFPTLLSGPTPGSASIPAGGTVEFEWVYQSAGNRTGANTWSGYAEGTDAVTSNPVASLPTTSNGVSVYDVVPDKSVQTSQPGGADPGEVVTYTITIRNTSSGNVQVRQITDTLPTGFTFITTTGYTTPPDAPPSQVGQTITWDYSISRPSIPGSGGVFTLTFTAQTESSSIGTFCNSVGFTRQGGGGTSCSGLACLTTAWPEYIIVAQAGSYRVRVRVRMEYTGPVILSWEFLP
ncbi:MAG: Ig-like domain-containing protein [Anaerolineae bacterium]|jgi:adhesin/invasin